MEQVEEGWWEGTLNGKHGVFPSNFVEMTEDSTGSPDESTPVPAAASAPEDKNKTGILGGYIESRKTIGRQSNVGNCMRNAVFIH